MTEAGPEPELVPIDDTSTILLGAGASHDCADLDAVLAKYPGGVAISDEIRSRILQHESLEQSSQPHDEQVRFLKALERLQPDHVRVLKAILAEPDPNTSLYMGSPRHVREKRLPDMPPDRIEESVLEANDLHLTKLENFRTTMTGHGAENTRTAITPFGQRLTRFLVD